MKKYVQRNVCPSGGCAGARSVTLGMGKVLHTPPRLVGATLYCHLCVLQQLHRALHSAIHRQQYAIDRGTLVTKYYTHDEPLFRLPASAQ